MKFHLTWHTIDSKPRRRVEGLLLLHYIIFRFHWRDKKDISNATTRSLTTIYSQIVFLNLTKTSTIFNSQYALGFFT